MSHLTMSEEQFAAYQKRLKSTPVISTITPKESKYRNKKTMVDGLVFASKREADRYQELRLLEKAGEITRLRLQPHIACDVNGTHVCTYVADFAYTHRGVSHETFEDSKGHRTALFILKKKLVFACHGIVIHEV